MIKNDIGKKLKNLRKKNLLSVHDVSCMFEKIGEHVREKTLYKWESGKTIPSINTLNKLAYMYNVNMSYFINEYKRCQALTDSELEFITTLRIDKIYKKIILLLAKSGKEV